VQPWLRYCAAPNFSEGGEERLLGNGLASVDRPCPTPLAAVSTVARALGRVGGSPRPPAQVPPPTGLGKKLASVGNPPLYGFCTDLTVGE